VATVIVKMIVDGGKVNLIGDLPRGQHGVFLGAQGDLATIHGEPPLYDSLLRLLDLSPKLVAAPVQVGQVVLRLEVVVDHGPLFDGRPYPFKFL
jgi:hypothetical protein